VALSEGPAAEAVWTHASDGVRLRAGLWSVDAPKGSILLFTGRTEYLEKYGRVAQDLTDAGYSILSMDWRGQGLSDRVTEDARLGHIDDFADYQLDVAAFVALAEKLDLPKPWYLIGHSMGGCIGLRAVLNDLPVEKAVFSAPMWGIFVIPRLRPIARILPEVARFFGKQLYTMPGTSPRGYVADSNFESNLLTTDRATWEYLARHAAADPAFALGGPTVHWFDSAIRETKALREAPRPTLPVKTLAGTREGVIDRKTLTFMHEDWPSASLEWIEGGRHELMMEAPAIRQQFFDKTLAFLDGRDA